MDSTEKTLRLKMSEVCPRVLAKYAEEGKEYLTVGMLYKIKIKKVNGTNLGCTNVTVESESNLDNKYLNIAGGTELIVYDKSAVSLTSERAPAAPPKEDAPMNTAPKEEVIQQLSTRKVSDMNKDKIPKPNMASIINPLLLEGKPAEEIADAVIAGIPAENKAFNKEALIKQIRGPRKYNLIKKLQKEGKVVPAHLLAKTKG